MCARGKKVNENLLTKFFPHKNKLQNECSEKGGKKKICRP